MSILRWAAFALVLAGCAADDADVQSADATEERLRVKGPPERLEPGSWLRDQTLAHAVVDAEVSLEGLLDVNVDVEVPADFWAETAGYLVAMEQGRTLTVDIEGPRVTLYTRPVGEREGTITYGQPAETIARTTGDLLVLVIPLATEPGADHIEYAIRGDLAP